MENEIYLKKQNPRENANFYSRTLFLWMLPLCIKSVKKTLTIFDLYKTLSWNKSDSVTDRLEQHWNNQVLNQKRNNKPPSLLKAIFQTFFWEYIKLGCFASLKFIILSNVQPIFFQKFIDSFSDYSDLDNNTLYGFISIIICFLLSFLNHHIEYNFASCGMRVRIAVSSLIYRKLLIIDKKAMGDYPAGHIVNLLSNDVYRFENCAMFLNFLWILPIQMVFLTWYLWTQVQAAVCVGLGFCILLLLIMTAFLPRKFLQLRVKTVEKSDERVKLMDEVISGIEVLKMYAWERPFEQMVKQIRSKEMKYIEKSLMLKGGYLAAAMLLQKIAVFLTAVTYVFLGNKLTASVVFPLYQSFNVFQTSMAYYLPCAILTGSDALISTRRIQKFLLVPTKPTASIQTNPNLGLQLKHIKASWSVDQPSISINLDIPRGSLCAIVGPVGAGKSSILQLVLGELVANSGSVSLSGSVSYSSQEPWLFSSTVKNNILFGQEYNAKTYKEIVRVCALEKDFLQLPNGDESPVGDRGVALSGGQKARINLARAIYRGADVYLLDDPLSAVDARISKHLFDECITGYLNGKTRVLVTHQLQYLKKADWIVVVNEGRVEAQGSFDQLSKANLDFAKLLVTSDQTESGFEQIKRKQSIHLNDHIKFSKIEENLTKTSSSPLKEYLQASITTSTTIWLFLLGLCTQILWGLSDVWLSYWTYQEQLRDTQSTPTQIESPLNLKVITKTHGIIWKKYSYIIWDVNNQTNHHEEQTGEIEKIIKTDIAIYIYAILLISIAVLVLIRNLAFFKTAANSSKRLHDAMLHSVIAAPKRFFDLNPSGRILNRFSRDISAIDEVIPVELVMSCTVFYMLIGISFILIFTNVYIAVPLVLLAMLFLQISKWYTNIGKNLKHLESTTKSYILSHVTASVSGLTTIRASSKEKRLCTEFDRHQDTHTSAYNLLLSAKACFGLWLDLISSCFVALVISSFIMLSKYGVVSDSVIGLAITQSIVLTNAFHLGIKQISDFINDLAIVERVIEYKNVKNEQDLGNYSNPNWPSAGRLQFQNISLSYSTLRVVLNNISFSVNPGEKIGIVGRTGAGKSSILNALFRLTTFEGSILIDGINTKMIKLQDLRKKISIIPQNPVLFSATLRYNLDPFAEFSDAHIWNALELVQMKKSVSTLNMMVCEGGNNFSIGQRQLLCLARAILRKNKILVLDEATANVDPKTDALIQDTIRKEFEKCTVLTIAHRLNTIMDSDKVLVLDNGQVIEFGHPHLLLQNSHGMFSRLLEEVGLSMAEQLKNVSRRSYLLNKNDTV